MRILSKFLLHSIVLSHLLASLYQLNQKLHLLEILSKQYQVFQDLCFGLYSVPVVILNNDDYSDDDRITTFFTSFFFLLTLGVSTAAKDRNRGNPLLRLRLLIQ